MDQDALKAIVDREDEELRILLQSEIAKGRESTYWCGARQPHVTSENDFDRKRMASEMSLKFRHLPIEAIRAAIMHQIMRVHMR